LDTGSTVFVRVAAVDATGLVSPWSGTVSGVPVQVETADIAVGAIDVERLADFVVTARKMGDLAHHIY
jgi:hypothetical protein